VEVEVIVNDESSISNLGLEYSTDEGETWRPPTLTDKGKIGEYRKSVTGGSRVVLDRTYTVPVYSKLRITVDDTEDNDLIYYTYNFILTTDVGVNYVVSEESSRTYGDITIR
jgi:Neuraminidase (sialidase)